MQDQGQVIRVNCKRCGGIMAKWERTPLTPGVLDVTYPFPFDKVCGRCLTKQDVDFYKRTGGMVMKQEKEITGIFRFNADSKKFKKFVFEASGEIVGNIFVPKEMKEMPVKIILTLRGE